MSAAGLARLAPWIAAGALIAGAGKGLAQTPPDAGSEAAWMPTPLPSPCPAGWLGLLGIYGSGDGVLLILERDGALEAMVKGGRFYALEALGPDRFRFPDVGQLAARNVVFSRAASGQALSLQLDEAFLPRDPASAGVALRLEPVRPVDELVRQAKAAPLPTADPPPTLPSDLVDLGALDPTIRVDLRYAGSNNPLGAPLLETSSAFLQRPAAEALVRAQRSLAGQGYGLVVHDAYHPWWVTKAVWDGAPPQARPFLENPADGSGYNRGTTVDVGLARLADGRVCELPSLYGEMSLRAYLDFPGGTSEQRWYRDALVEVMESAGFDSLSSQWWRYDLPQGRRFPLLNGLPGAEDELAR